MSVSRLLCEGNEGGPDINRGDNPMAVGKRGTRRLEVKPLIKLPRSLRILPIVRTMTA
jgi:hypothetical protein